MIKRFLMISAFCAWLAFGQTPLPRLPLNANDAVKGLDRGRDAMERPSLRTGQATFSHPALQLVVTFLKIDTPRRELALRSTNPWW